MENPISELTSVVWPFEGRERLVSCSKCCRPIVAFVLPWWEEIEPRVCSTCWDERARLYGRKAVKRGKLRQNQTWKRLVLGAEINLPEWLRPERRRPN
jgi:hypothetical protein